MSEQATEPGVVDGVRLQKCLKTRRTNMVSLGDVMEVGMFIGGRRFRSHRRRLIENPVPKQSAPFSPVSSKLLGSVSHE